jgi:hypothetical protein
MKKVYVTPHSEAIQLLGENAIMAGSPALTTFDLMYGNGSGGGMR